MANRIPNHGIYARLITEYVSHKRSLGYKMEETEEIGRASCRERV